MKDIDSVYRLAQEAAQRAREAQTAISTHEILCAERYDNIKQKLDVVQAIKDSVESMQLKQAEQVALHKALIIVTLVIGLFYTVMKVTGHA